MRNLSSKGIRFSGDSIKSCVCFIDLVDSTKNTITMEGLENIRKYYSTFINSVSDIVKSSSGKVIKNIGDCLLCYFPNDLLVVLDIRIKNFNGLQLHQQIKAIDPAIKIIFITSLDILDELLSIVLGIKYSFRNTKRTNNEKTC
jgi:CheY-like chemotaxis protein